MTTKRAQLENYKKYLLNRNTASAVVVSYIENCIVSEDEAAKHSFHKIMVHNWPGSHVELFETLMDYFQSTFTPVNYTSQGEITTFYTSSLNFVMKAIKHDFMFPYQRNMFNLDLLFNDKSSADCFDNRVTVDDVVAGVVSNRLSDKFELNLSNFEKDPEFIDKKIHFYKLGLLSQYKILMIRMGRDTKSLNLSHNNLTTIPVELLNFFIKGDLTAINLSYNEIPALSELQRNSKVEKLWIEGNPLCENLDPSTYVKNIIMRFPRLTELDGITLNQHGVMLPFFKNFLETPDKKTKMLVEKFLTLYFAHYDSNRKKISEFYDNNATLTVNTSFTDAEDAELPAYAKFSRNVLHPAKRRFVLFNNKMCRNRTSCVQALLSLPKSEHDPTTFCVDVLRHDTGRPELNEDLNRMIHTYGEPVNGLTTSPSILLASPSLSSVSSLTVSSYPQSDLTLLLQSTPDGQILLKQDPEKPLGEQYRKILTRIISNEILKEDPKAQIKSATYLSWLQEISKLFPLENLESYYTQPRVGLHRAHGRLSDGVSNLKAKYRKHRVYEPRARRSLEKTPAFTSAAATSAHTSSASTSSASSSAASTSNITEEEEECLEWLRCSSDDYAVCVQKWQITNQQRKQRVISNEKVSYHQEFPCLKRSWGYSLKKCLILVVDGTLRSKSIDRGQPDHYFRFRRTFMFSIYNVHPYSVYHINNEMFTISVATQEQIENSFKVPLRNMNSLTLINPEREEREALCRAFTHTTQLKRAEAELRLKIHSWDIRSAVKEFLDELKNNKITADKFIEDEYDDFSDTSSLIDEVD